ncbi:MAG TPA: methyl-accepting chemotaxis protein [Candidatus Acidoferrales bacterium]|nr:methyl-accepting chemotaxis protein [Candidatus Acidoferrales bacterium]
MPLADVLIQATPKVPSSPDIHTAAELASGSHGPGSPLIAPEKSTQDVAAGLRQIGSLAKSVAAHFRQAVQDIVRINLQTKILSLNAQVEAARAGTVGNAFGVVATEMVGLSEQTASVTGKLATETQDSITSLNHIITGLGQDIRGTRLSDLAMMNIDVIDRNLYERSCDVRWWAADGSAVDALTKKTPEACAYAAKRLGVILDSYTVYFDIVLCDVDGTVVANGRKDSFRSRGTSQKQAAWFQAAIKTTDGTQFGFQNVHRTPTLADGKNILVYSCGVRANGDARGRIIGVIGIIFNWEALGQTVVNGTLISAAEKDHTRVCIVDGGGLVLADSHGKIIQETLKLPRQRELFGLKKGYIMDKFQGDSVLIAHAFSPGFETYATGWHSLIIQKLDMP